MLLLCATHRRGDLLLLLLLLNLLHLEELVKFIPAAFAHSPAHAPSECQEYKGGLPGGGLLAQHPLAQVRWDLRQTCRQRTTMLEG